MKLSDLPPGVSVNDPHINPPDRMSGSRRPRTYKVVVPHAPRTGSRNADRAIQAALLVRALTRELEAAKVARAEAEGRLNGRQRALVEKAL